MLMLHKTLFDRVVVSSCRCMGTVTMYFKAEECCLGQARKLLASIIRSGYIEFVLDSSFLKAACNRYLCLHRHCSSQTFEEM